MNDKYALSMNMNKYNKDYNMFVFTKMAMYMCYVIRSKCNTCNIKDKSSM